MPSPRPKIEPLFTRTQVVTASRIGREISTAVARLTLLKTFTRLRAHGMTAGEAARFVGFSVPTAWRYSRQFARSGWAGLVPATARSGRRKSVES